MSEHVSTILESASKNTSLPWLSAFRKNSMTRLQAGHWPAKKAEHWVHSPLSRIDNAFGQTVIDTDEPAELAHIEIADLGAIRMVFVDGIFDEEGSTLPENGWVEIVPFSQANDNQQLVIKTHLGQALELAENRQNHIFADINGALIEDGLLVHIAKNTLFSQPIHVVYQSTGNSSSVQNQSRLLVVLDTGAEATVIEHFVSAQNDDTNTLSNNVTELIVGDNANLNHYRLSIEEQGMVHIGAVHAYLSADSNLNSFVLNLGSWFKRTDFTIQHTASGSHSELAGMYLPHGEEHVDLRTFVEHRVPHCTSNEVIRGILDDQSKAVFNGRIHIHPQAQKTEANLSNKNLLLNQGAEVYTKPELEIYADDVRCSHGATVSQIQNEALYYMQTRGIPRKEAEIMLSYGFINELVANLKLEPLQAYLQPMLARLFTKDSSLLRHIG